MLWIDSNGADTVLFLGAARLEVVAFDIFSAVNSFLMVQHCDNIVLNTKSFGVEVKYGEFASA